MTCSRCGVDIEEAVGAIAKKKQWKAERKQLRADNDALSKKANDLTAQVATMTTQIKSLEAAILHSASAASAASGAPVAKEETVAVPGRREDKRAIQR